jgi:SAM-dependent methyltransferase
MELNNEYWSNHYVNNTHRWDIGHAAPAICRYIDGITNKNISILIPGCGNAYEAAYLLEKGFTNITLVDISSVLTERLRERFANAIDRIHIIHGDFFELEGQFDLIIEQTFFCALNPSFRKAYAEKMFALLKPGGKLAGLLFDRMFEGGPPFGGSKQEYEDIFSQYFMIEQMDACKDSIEPRAGTELWFCLRK